MKQYPSRLKFKKYHRPSLSNLVAEQKKYFHPLRGLLALKSIENGRLQYKQLEACRKSIKRMVKKIGFVQVCVFTGASITRKPVAVRMGKGKGSHSVWVTFIKKGQVLFEVTFNKMSKLDLNIRALKAGSSKLPLKTRVSFNFY